MNINLVKTHLKYFVKGTKLMALGFLYVMFLVLFNLLVQWYPIPVGVVCILILIWALGWCFSQ